MNASKYLRCKDNDLNRMGGADLGRKEWKKGILGDPGQGPEAGCTKRSWATAREEFSLRLE